MAIIKILYFTQEIFLILSYLGNFYLWTDN